MKKIVATNTSLASRLITTHPYYQCGSTLIDILENSTHSAHTQTIPILNAPLDPDILSACKTIAGLGFLGIGLAGETALSGTHISYSLVQSITHLLVTDPTLALLVGCGNYTTLQCMLLGLSLTNIALGISIYSAGTLAQYITKYTVDNALKDHTTSTYRLATLATQTLAFLAAQILIPSLINTVLAQTSPPDISRTQALQTLGLPETATPETIRSRFRELVLNPNCPEQDAIRTAHRYLKKLTKLKTE